tara:strand:+ start:892 stop:1092 length:201 start_codon:yes stop_codon:yes gene_type:complete
MKLTEQGFLDKLYQKWRDKKLSGTAKKMLDTNPELKKAFININKSNQRAMDIMCKKYPNLKNCLKK